MLRAQGRGNAEGLQPRWPGLAPGVWQILWPRTDRVDCWEETHAHVLGGRTPLRAAGVGRSHSEGTPGPGRGNGPHGLQLGALALITTLGYWALTLGHLRDTGGTHMCHVMSP